MTEPFLTPFDVSGLRLYANPHDVLHDLHMYVQYMAGRSVKRMTRTNQIPRADINRLIKLMSAAEELQAIVNEFGGSGWLNFIDRFALQMNLVDYDTTGKYRGYSSREPSYLDNYISVLADNYRDFLALDPSDQMHRILKKLIHAFDPDDRTSSVNEFYQTGVMGRLDAFNLRGSATGVMPSLDLPKIRTFLFDVLAGCEPGIWYGTAALIAWLKKQHPYFIIPEVIPPDRWGKIAGRYDNFYDGQEKYYNREHVSPADPDAFERVEGRYIERFLEHVPLSLRLVDLAYDPRPYHDQTFPMLGWLKAFRLTPAFHATLHREHRPARVTVLPNFEVVLESQFYPAQTVARLDALADRGPAPPGSHAITFFLKKERVAAELVKDPDLDPVALLETLSGAPLPSNVAAEVAEWSGHADQFTLYEGFDLLESRAALPDLDALLVVQITPELSLIRKGAVLFDKLEKAERIPVCISHTPNGFQPIPPGAASVFPHVPSPLPGSRSAAPASLTIRRVEEITLHFPSDEIGAQAFEDVRRALAEARCPVKADLPNLTMTLPGKYLPTLEQVVQSLEDVYQVQIQHD